MSTQKVFVSAVSLKGKDSFLISKNEYQGYQAIRDCLIDIVKENNYPVDTSEIKNLRFMASNIEDSKDTLISFVTDNPILDDKITLLIPQETSIDISSNNTKLYAGAITWNTGGDVFVGTSEKEIKQKGIDFANEYWEAELRDCNPPTDPDELLEQYFSSTDEVFSFGEAKILGLNNEKKISSPSP